MVNTLESWETVNEGIFTQNKGKQILTGPNGKKQKVVYRIKSDSEFILKIVRFDDLIVNGVITRNGADQFIKFFNSQLALVKTFGRMDNTFFDNKFITYVVRRDTDRVEKLLFKIENKTDHPEIPTNIKFISVKDLARISKENEATPSIITNIERDAEVEQVDGDPSEIVTGTEDDAKGSNETVASSGGKFRYTMRTNSKTYLMEFTEDGAIDADIVGQGKPNGAISWESPSVMWFTNADNKVEVESSKWAELDKLDLYTDGEIVNKADKEFFTKIFTDASFRNKIIAEYEEKYGSTEINGENLKNMLYHLDTTKMFGTDGETSDEVAATSKPEEPAGRYSAEYF